MGHGPLTSRLPVRSQFHPAQPCPRPSSASRPIPKTPSRVLSRFLQAIPVLAPRPTVLFSLTATWHRRPAYLPSHPPGSRRPIHHPSLPNPASLHLERRHHGKPESLDTRQGALVGRKPHSRHPRPGSQVTDQRNPDKGRPCHQVRLRWLPAVALCAPGTPVPLVLPSHSQRGPANPSLFLTTGSRSTSSTP